MGLLTDREKGLLNQDSIEEARKGKIVYLDLEDIRLNPENIWTVNDEEIRIKRQSIEEVGLLQPLLVKKTQRVEIICILAGDSKDLFPASIWMNLWVRMNLD